MSVRIEFKGQRAALLLKKMAIPTYQKRGTCGQLSFWGTDFQGEERKYTLFEKEIVLICES